MPVCTGGNIGHGTTSSSGTSSPFPDRERELPRCGYHHFDRPRRFRYQRARFYWRAPISTPLASRTQIPGVPTIPGLQTNGTIIGGQYTLKGAGGKDVGPFTATVNLGSPLTITGGLPSTVNRGSGLPLSWTGGNSSDLVIIEGLAITTSTTTTASGTTFTENGGEFVCTTTVGTGGLTVPASITSQIPALNPASSDHGYNGALDARRLHYYQPVERQWTFYRSADGGRKHLAGILPRFCWRKQRAGLAVDGYRSPAGRITIGSMSPSGLCLLTLAALPCLAAVTDKQCTDLLQHALNASNPDTRKTAVVALSLAAADGALFDQLRTTLHDKDVEVRVGGDHRLARAEDETCHRRVAYGARRPCAAK